jgi:hypothetical protein
MVQELIRSKILTGEAKRKFDETMDRIFPQKQKYSGKRIEQREGFTIIYNYPEKEKNKLMTCNDPRGFNPKVMDGMF